MQLGSKEEETERFNHYLKKTYKKTASLIANSCKAVSVFFLPVFLNPFKANLEKTRVKVKKGKGCRFV